MEGEAVSGVSALITALVTALTSAATSIMGALGDILPVVLPVGAGIVAVRIGWKFFKSLTK